MQLFSVINLGNHLYPTNKNKQNIHLDWFR